MSSRRRDPRSSAGLAASAPVRRVTRAFCRTTTKSSGADSFALACARERAAGFVDGVDLDFGDLEVARFFDKKWSEK